MKKGEKFERVKISENKYKELKKIEKNVNSAKILKRILSLKLIYRNWKYGEIADFLSVTKNTISNWINLYKKGGINRILTLKYKGAIPRLTQAQLAELKKESSKCTIKIAKIAKQFIKTQFGVDYKLRQVQYLLKKNFEYPINKQD